MEKPTELYWPLRPPLHNSMGGCPHLPPGIHHLRYRKDEVLNRNWPSFRLHLRFRDYHARRCTTSQAFTSHGASEFHDDGPHLLLPLLLWTVGPQVCCQRALLALSSSLRCRKLHPPPTPRRPPWGRRSVRAARSRCSSRPRGGHNPDSRSPHSRALALASELCLQLQIDLFRLFRLSVWLG